MLAGCGSVGAFHVECALSFNRLPLQHSLQHACGAGRALQRGAATPWHSFVCSAHPLSCSTLPNSRGFGFVQGIVKALLDANLLPRVVSGSSAGSIGEWSGCDWLASLCRWLACRLCRRLACRLCRWLACRRPHDQRPGARARGPAAERARLARCTNASREPCTCMPPSRVPLPPSMHTLK